MSSAKVREARTDELEPGVLDGILELCRACWPNGGFTHDDFDHALGGRHFLAEIDGRIISHAAVVPRRLELDGHGLRAGYVEAVATLPGFRRRGLARRLMTLAGAHVATTYELGALSTGVPWFYERLGWRRWAGETWVREADGTLTRTPGDDDGILVLPTPRLVDPSVTGSLVCERRPGDVW